MSLADFPAWFTVGFAVAFATLIIDLIQPFLRRGDSGSAD